MGDVSKLQQELFRVIRSISPNLSATDEISKILNIGVDGAYRRIRGETPISLDDFYALCVHYKISLEDISNVSTGGVKFNGNFVNDKSFRYDDFLKGMIRDLTYMNSFKKRDFYFLCKDTPIFYHFLSRDIAAFKYFFWLKTIYNFPEFENKRFNFNTYPDELSDLGEKVLDLYNELPCTEFWNLDTINIAVRQIEFYRSSRMFESDHDILRLYEAWEKVIDHIEKQAECGYKFSYHDLTMKPIGRYRIYFNEVVLGDNSMLVLLEESKMCILAHASINYLITRDVNFCENMYEYVQNLMKRSTLISNVSEKERSKFFRLLRERIERRKNTLSVSINKS
jgi:hypothetical protein